jgi:4-hydroxy-tetrahydrodipicolinate synthase
VNNIASYKVILKAEGILNTVKMRRPMENLLVEKEEEMLTVLRKAEYKIVLV